MNLESKSTLGADINSILPSELLASIFTFPINDAIDAISFNLPGGQVEAEVRKRFKQHPLWNASLVCRAWYGIIKNTRRFWTFVAIGFTPLAGPSASTSGPPTSHSPHQKERLTGIENVLERSGRLPLTVVLCPENIRDLISVSQALDKHLDRLEILSLVASDNQGPVVSGNLETGFRVTIRTHCGITLNQAPGLLARPLPNLKHLSISRCLRSVPDSMLGREMSGHWHREVDAPQLETISCHTYLIIPSSPTRLSSLSLIHVDLGVGLGVDFDRPGRRSVELPHLVDLRIKDCAVGTLLSTLVTLSLRRLVVVDSWYTDEDTEAQLPLYDNLQELQWAGTGGDHVFVRLCHLCPNLKRYLSYIEQDSIEEDIKMTDNALTLGRSRPRLLSVFDEDAEGRVNAYRHWPILEEVSFDRASCDDLATVIGAIPSIKRVRVLRDPVLSSHVDSQEGERDKLAVLRGKVEMAIRDEPWGSGTRRNETPREVAVRH
ncbi:hypothetical protein FS837_002282 [Tulasnella sp. UAMH 9824]|nr:hypothetical protein FS837_002282 [Tulasnella sp. UAMH 9824]